MDTVNVLFKNFGIDRITRLFETFGIFVLLIKQVALSFFTTELPVPDVKMECLVTAESEIAIMDSLQEDIKNFKFFQHMLMPPDTWEEES